MSKGYDLIKQFLKYIFTIDEKHKNKVKKLKIYEHILARVLILILISPISYVLIFGYIANGLTFFNIFRTILLLILVRGIIKEPMDSILILLFYKSSYKINDNVKYVRKRKLRKLRTKRILKL